VDIDTYAVCIGSCYFQYVDWTTPLLTSNTMGTILNYPLFLTGALRGVISVC
jgi:hypothetical protein